MARGREGTPVRPAAIWLDGRASQRAEQWNDDGRAVRVFEVTGTKIFGVCSPSHRGAIGNGSTEYPSCRHPPQLQGLDPVQAHWGAPYRLHGGV